MFASVCWGRCCGFGTNSSPGSCTRSFALDLKTGLGSTIGPLMTHELEMSINHRSGEILSHEVRRIMSSENFTEFELVTILLLLNPQGTDVDVAELAGFLMLANAQSCRELYRGGDLPGARSFRGSQHVLGVQQRMSLAK